MALPTAPLGQLPNLSLPTHGQIYEKQSTIDKALAAFLVGVAQQAGSGMIQNALSHDYAPEDQQSAWYKKPFVGPTEDKQVHLQKMQEQGALERLGTSEANANDRLRQQLEATEREGRLTREQQSMLENLRLKSEADRLRETFQHQDTMQGAGFTHDTSMANLGLTNAKDLSQFRQGLPPTALEQSQIVENTSRAGLSNLEADRIRKMLEMFSGKTGAPTDSKMHLSPEELAALKDSPQTPAYNVPILQGVKTGGASTAPTSQYQYNDGLPTVDEVVNPQAITQPHQSLPAMAGPLSNNDPFMDPLLNKLAEFLRNPPAPSWTK